MEILKKTGNCPKECEEFLMYLLKRIQVGNDDHTSCNETFKDFSNIYVNLILSLLVSFESSQNITERDRKALITKSLSYFLDATSYVVKYVESDDFKELAAGLKAESITKNAGLKWTKSNLN